MLTKARRHLALQDVGGGSRPELILLTRFQRHACGVKHRPVWLNYQGILGGPYFQAVVVGLHLFGRSVEMKGEGDENTQILGGM